MREVDAYALFNHPNIITSIDHSIASDRSDAGAKTVYIVLPYYRRGNLQDIINANLVNGTKFPEKKLMVLFLGVCKALTAMHEYKVGGGKKTKGKGKGRAAEQEAEESRGRKGRERVGDEDDDEAEAPLMESEVTTSQQGVAPGQVRAYAHRDIKPGENSKILMSPCN
jgi:serine/threonine kinase 16